MAESPTLIRVKQHRRLPLLLSLLAMLAAGFGVVRPSPAARAITGPLPPPVVVRSEPQGVKLADPAFAPLPGAKAYFGRLGGSVYQIEIPDRWNGRLVLYMHGFQGLASEARVEQPSLRDYLIRNGFAWGASSFSSTALIPGRAADETAALWDEFARTFGRPTWTYVTGHSMGGAATNIAAERYANRFDGALSLCGYAGQTAITQLIGDYFVAGAYVAGVSQAEFESTPVGQLIYGRIVPALADPARRAAFEQIMLDLTGGPRALDDEGFRLEEATNWERARILVSSDLISNRDRVYRLGPLSGVPSAQFNRDVLRLDADPSYLQNFNAGNELSGFLEMPLLTLHTTGDWQVPIDQQQILKRTAQAAGRGGLLVQRIIRDPKHCGFTNAEWAQGLTDLIAWTERGVKPLGDDVLVSDLRGLGTTFTLTPRVGTPEAERVAGASARVTVSGRLTLDGRPLQGAYVGLVVRRGSDATDCTYSLEPVFNGALRRELPSTVELAGCGGPGAKLFAWALVDGRALISQQSVDWPGAGGMAKLNATFSRKDPQGGDGPAAIVFGDVLDERTRPLPPGTVIEARAGGTVCARGTVAPVVRVAFVTYVLVLQGPKPPPCGGDATLRLYVAGRPARESLDTTLDNRVVQINLNVLSPQ